MLITEFEYNHNQICGSTSYEMSQFDALMQYNKSRSRFYQNVLPNDIFVALDTVDDAAKILQGAETAAFIKGFAIISKQGDVKFALVLER